MKKEYQKPIMEVMMHENTPRTIIEDSNEFGSGEDIWA